MFTEATQTKHPKLKSNRVPRVVEFDELNTTTKKCHPLTKIALALPLLQRAPPSRAELLPRYLQSVLGPIDEPTGVGCCPLGKKREGCGKKVDRVPQGLTISTRRRRRPCPLCSQASWVIGLRGTCTYMQPVATMMCMPTHA